MKVFCRRNGCLNEAEPENYIRDTPLCLSCEAVIRRLVESGTRPNPPRKKGVTDDR